MSMRNRFYVFLLLLFSATATAAPTDDARAHLQAIAAGEVDQVMAQFADDAVFQWVGGPLDGVYRGTDAIRQVWSRFAKANSPMQLQMKQIEAGANPKGATVLTSAIFAGRNTVKARYIPVYRDGRIVNAVWQVDPSL